MKFFFDENISHVIVRSLAILERSDKPDFPGKHQLVHTFNRYPPERRPVLDTTYIPEVTREGYIIVTGDWAQKITRGKHAAESKMYRDHNAIAFWLPKRFSGLTKKSHASPVADMKFTQASLLFAWWPSIKWTAGTASPGDLFDVLDGGKIVKRS